MRLILEFSPATRGMTLEGLRANKGVARYTGVSMLGKMWCGTTDYKIDEPLVAFQRPGGQEAALAHITPGSPPHSSAGGPTMRSARVRSR